VWVNGRGGGVAVSSGMGSCGVSCLWSGVGGCGFLLLFILLCSSLLFFSIPIACVPVPCLEPLLLRVEGIRAGGGEKEREVRENKKER